MDVELTRFTLRCRFLSIAAGMALFTTGCSARVELGVDVQFDSGAGGYVATNGTQDATGGFVASVGGTSAGTRVHASGGATGVSTSARLATGGSTVTSLRAPDAAGSECLTVSNNYATTPEFAGYASTYAIQGDADSAHAVTVSPQCDATGCAPAFAANGICASGVVGASVDYTTSAGITFNVNQPASGDPNDSRKAVLLARYGLMVQFSNTAGSPLRVQLLDVNSLTYCFELSTASGTSYIPWSYFNTACWDNSGTVFSAAIPIVSIQLMVPGAADSDIAYDFCLRCVATFSGLQ